jgi:Zn-finger nucleic acid-binding protein
MSQSQIDATGLICQLLEKDKAEIDGQTLQSGANSDAAHHILRERLLVLGKPKDWVTCPECGIELAQVVRDIGVDKVALRCPQCQDVAAARHLTATHKVSLSKFIQSMMVGLDMKANSQYMIRDDQIWRLGTTQQGRAKVMTWYFARHLHRPEIAALLKEQIALDKTQASCMVLTSSDVPLPAGSPLTGYDVRSLVTMGRVTQSKFDFIPDRIGAIGPQVLDEATPGTTLRYVESQSIAFVEGKKYNLTSNQQAILLALVRARDHELDKETLKDACGSEAQTFSPSKEFQRNKVVYDAFIAYRADDRVYALSISEEDGNWLT